MYARRVCNHVAHTLHTLAKQVLNGNRMGEWHVAPSCIANLLTEDRTPAVPGFINESKSEKEKASSRLGFSSSLL